MSDLVPTNICWMRLGCRSCTEKVSVPVADFQESIDKVTQSLENQGWLLAVEQAEYNNLHFIPMCSICSRVYIRKVIQTKGKDNIAPLVLKRFQTLFPELFEHPL